MRRVLLIITGILTLYHLGGFIQVDTAQRWLHLGWTLIFAATAISVWQYKTINRALTMLIVFIAYSALRLLLFTRSDYDRQRLPFVLVLLLLIGIAITLIRFRRMIRNKDKIQ